MSTKITIESILKEFDLQFVEFSEEGRKQVAKKKAWYNSNTESWEDENEVDEIKSFISSSLKKVIESLILEIEGERKKHGVPNKIVNNLVRREIENFNSGLSTAKNLLEEYKKQI